MNNLSNRSITIFNFVHLGSKNVKLPARDSKFPPLSINTSIHPNNMGFSFLPPFSDDATVQNELSTTGNSTSSSDPDAILEQHLELLLKAVQQKSGTFSPRAQDRLKLLNALVSTETLVTTSARSTATSESLYSW